MSATNNEYFGPVSSGRPQAPEELSLGRAIADDLITSVEIPECSVAASDTAELAEEIFEYKEPHYNFFKDPDAAKPNATGLELARRHNFNLLLTDNENLPQDVSLKWVSPTFKSRSGHSIRLALARPDKEIVHRHPGDEEINHLTLFAITRHNVAFPLARFGRSNQVFCDHIQFWGEEDGDELDSSNFYNWGGDDNGSRFDAVQALHSLLKNSGPNDNENAAIALVEKLQLAIRLEKKLGTTTPEIEQLISLIFSSNFDKNAHTFSQEFPNQPFGRVVTDITVEGRLEPVDESVFERKVSIRAFPSSQARRKWEAREFIVNLHGNITSLDGTAAPRDLDVRTMLDLIEDESTQETTTPTEQVAATNETSFFNDYLTYDGISLIAYGSIRSAYNFITQTGFAFEQYIPTLTAPAMITGLGAAAISSARRKSRKARANAGGEEEEA